MFSRSTYNVIAAMTTVGNVLVDQSEADEDLSITQRVALAGGSALEGAADFAGDIQPLADTLTVAGMDKILCVIEYISAACVLCMYRWCCQGSGRGRQGHELKTESCSCSW